MTAKTLSALLEKTFGDLCLTSIQDIRGFFSTVKNNYEKFNRKYNVDVKINSDTSDIKDFFTSCDVRLGLSCIKEVVKKVQGKGVKYGGMSRRIIGNEDLRRHKMDKSDNRGKKNIFIEKNMVDDFVNRNKFKKQVLYARSDLETNSVVLYDLDDLIYIIEHNSKHSYVKNIGSRTKETPGI